MKLRRKVLALVTLLTLALTFSFSEGNQEVQEGPKEITVLTHRTDLVDNLFQDYVKEFNKIHPDITVNYEAITDYEGQIKIRMNTTQYGDLLMIADSGLAPSEYPDFFEPLGTMEDMDPKYEFSNESEYDGLVYGISSVGNAQGIIYNKEVFKAAGVTKMPSTPDEFIAALTLIKENTDAIPYYTNYSDGWPLGGQWESQAPNVAGDPTWYQQKLAKTDAPWTEGQPYYVLSKMLDDIVRNELCEMDPTTTDWESSKGMIAKGEIASMVLGSWSIIQMQQAAESLGIDPGVIGYMPFPYTNADGNMYAAVGSDRRFAINKHSKNKEAARLYLDWFTHESGFAQSQSGISPVKGAPYPDALVAFGDLGVKFFQNAPALPGEESLLDDVDSESEIGRWSEGYRQRIVEAGFGARDESFQDIMDDLNAKWAKARTTLGVE